jgi:DNA-binding response OmpR family regulator
MKKVLLIDDDKTMVSLLQTLLELEGFQVSALTQPSQQDIINILSREDEFICLVDVFLKDIDGFDVLGWIKKVPRQKRVPVIMTSGMDVRFHCLEKGADAFLLKPYMPQDLIDLLKRI